MPRSWKPTKRRRCTLESCNQLYWPKQKHQRFCCPVHKSEYHLKSPSFRKLQDEIVILLRKTLKPECFRVP
jgi:hypothetical protein